ncbi:hypothetical protein ALC60_12320 [Trachymyrmex zeteki]|uniref:Odorant receptor n=1 Tax=Mycetomoellerius zeteki TaxID=64791 RepID=A0A151WL73_9HYME|nr:hypothetical protein ALC60_12320 [Trachymyrmex zeteki]
MEKYACNARLFTIILMVYCYFGLIFCGIFQYLPMILDVILPLNDSRPCQLFVVTEYFINQEKYFYVILIHETLAYSVGTAILCSTSATIMACILHTCALFKIARFAELLTSSFAVLFFIIIVIGVSSLSFNLFQCFQLITLMNDIREIIITIIIIFCHLSYMFILNYAGQELINHGLHFFKASYNGLWYTAPLHTQKLLLFIMQRGIINTVFICGKIYVASLEGFAMLKHLLVQIQNDWNSLKDKLEIDIIKKYANNIRIFTMSVMAFCYIFIFFFGILQHLPLILDIILPLNETRPCQLLLITEYFVNQDKYIYVIMLHEFLVSYIGLTTTWGTGTTIMIYITHVCALLKIASYRIENAIERNILAIPSPKREYLLHQRIVHAVIIHQRAIESVFLYLCYKTF